jgi:hypothetical protein
MSAQIINLSDRRKKLSKASPNLMGVSLSIFAAHADVSLAMYVRHFLPLPGEDQPGAVGIPTTQRSVKGGLSKNGQALSDRHKPSGEGFALDKAASPHRLRKDQLARSVCGYG